VNDRTLGKTGLRVSALGFGCGNVGGLMVRGAPAERERAVARALELGINYFDTAPSYGNGLSEQNLGLALKALRVTPTVGTKFNLSEADRRDVPGAIARSLETSLRRLGLDRVDLLQCHERIVPAGATGSRLAEASHIGVDRARVVDEIVPALQKLRGQGKLRFYGITALGDTEALHETLDSGALDTAQVCFNLLNPSAGYPVPRGFPAQDFKQMLRVAARREVGVIAIRVLAAGALSGTEARHPIAVPSVDPIASGPDYGTDVRRTQALRALVNEGHADSLVEASLRFALTDDAVSTVLLGYSSLEHLEYAATSVEKGPLPGAARERLRALWNQFTESG
jgi:aryl-alcohol dehydrogenase-like predicted oxidoreductase